MLENLNSVRDMIQEAVSGGRDMPPSSPMLINNSELSGNSNGEMQDETYSQIPEDIDPVPSESGFKEGKVAYYPSDLGTERNAHYVKFEVFLVDTKNLNLVQGDANFPPKPDESGAGMRSQSADGMIKEQQQNVVSFIKLEEMIGLPMPDSIVTDHSTIWSKAEGGLVSQGIGVTDMLLGNVENASKMDKLENLVKTLALGMGSGISGMMNQLGMDGTETNLKILTKRALNPRNEFLFDGVNNRAFNLQWKFIPKSKEEAMSLRIILEKMKLYMYPELDQSASGAFYLFPALFDITFMQGSAENEWLYRTSSCALTNMIINYTGAGQWVATNERGAPVAWDLTMQFTETEFLHRSRFKNAGNPNGVAR